MAIRILVADDNRDLVLSLSRLLELMGHSVSPAYCAREALDVLDEVPVDLVLSDIRMPDVDGFDLLRVLRHRFRSLPVILMSGLPITSEDIVPLHASIVQKPIDINELERLIQQKIELSRR